MISLFELVGILVSIYVLVRVVLVKAAINIGSFVFGWGQVSDLKSYGRWAVVTGGTDGIGKAYAHELASRGLNLVLISNQPEQGAQLAHELSSKFGSLVKFINADFRGFFSLTISLSLSL